MLLVSQIMSTEVISVGPRERLSRARDLMVEHRVHHLPVLDGERLVGMVSAADLLLRGFSLESNATTSWQRGLDPLHAVADAMATDPVRIGIGRNVLAAAEMLATGDFHALPVVDGDRLVGIVTTTDLVRLLRNELAARELPTSTST